MIKLDYCLLILELFEIIKEVPLTNKNLSSLFIGGGRDPIINIIFYIPVYSTREKMMDIIMPSAKCTRLACWCCNRQEYQHYLSS